MVFCSCKYCFPPFPTRKLSPKKIYIYYRSEIKIIATVSQYFSNIIWADNWHLFVSFISHLSQPIPNSLSAYKSDQVGPDLDQVEAGSWGKQSWILNWVMAGTLQESSSIWIKRPLAERREILQAAWDLQLDFLAHSLTSWMLKRWWTQGLGVPTELLCIKVIYWFVLNN